MKYNFDIIPDRENTACVKFDKREETFCKNDILPMWIADMDFAVAPCISEALMKRTKHQNYGYAFRDDTTFSNVIKWVKRRNGWDIKKEWLSFTPGVVSGLVFGIKAFSKPGDGVVIQPPVYPPFSEVVKANDRKLLCNPMKLVNGEFRIDFEDLDKKLAEAKVFLLCNPHNPTARVYTEEELRKMGELCIKHDVYILSDEIHSDLIFKPHKHIHIASLSPEIAKRTVTMIAPSKTFNVAGLSSSAAIASEKETHSRFCEEINKVHVGGGNIFGNVAMCAAYGGGEDWLEQLLVYLKGNVDYVTDYIAEHMPLIQTYKTEGTFLMWLNFSKLGMDCEKLAEFMVEEAAIGMNSGRDYGEEGCKHMRLNIGTSRAIIVKAMGQLDEAYNKLEVVKESERGQKK